MFVEYLGPHSLQYGATTVQHYLGKTLKDTTFLRLAVLRHQNIKMSIYKVDKNDWVL